VPRLILSARAQDRNATLWKSNDQRGHIEPALAPCSARAGPRCAYKALPKTEVPFSSRSPAKNAGQAQTSPLEKQNRVVMLHEGLTGSLALCAGQPIIAVGAILEALCQVLIHSTRRLSDTDGIDRARRSSPRERNEESGRRVHSHDRRLQPAESGYRKMTESAGAALEPLMRVK
jgi:energy-converting hydrogenase Eha subunit C